MNNVDCQQEIERGMCCDWMSIITAGSTRRVSTCFSNERIRFEERQFQSFTSLYCINILIASLAVVVETRERDRGLIFLLFFQRTVTDTYKGKKYVLVIHTYHTYWWPIQPQKDSDHENGNKLVKFSRRARISRVTFRGLTWKVILCALDPSGESNWWSDRIKFKLRWNYLERAVPRQLEVEGSKLFSRISPCASYCHSVPLDLPASSAKMLKCF